MYTTDQYEGMIAETVTVRAKSQAQMETESSPIAPARWGRAHFPVWY